MILHLTKSNGMEQEYVISTLFFRRLFVVFTFTGLYFFFSSCELLWYQEKTQVYPESFACTQRFEIIPDDSTVTCSKIALMDTVLYKSFDDIIYLNSTYLTHAKRGLRTWFEVDITTSFDTTNIEIFARQYTLYNPIEPSQYDGVVLYKDHLFLTRFDSTSSSCIKRCINDSITFNRFYQGMDIYFILNYEYNLPEYAYAQYVCHNGLVERKRAEINNFLFENGFFKEKE